MNLSQVKTVAIVGAGVAGLSTAKALLAQGLDCTVFERRSHLGGVWAEGYANFGVQVQRELYEFPDWPLPKEVPDFTPGPRVQQYLSDYADHFGVTPHIQFDTLVSDIRERADDNPGWQLSYRQGGRSVVREFDLVVICVGLYSHTPHRPQFPGRECFQGEVLHSSEIKDPQQLKDRKVAILGYGKSATDIAVESAAVARQTTLVFRQCHWPVPAKLVGILPFKWALFNRLTSALLPLYYRPSSLELWLHRLGKPMIWLWWRIVELILILQCGLWSRFGTRTSLVPDRAVEMDAFSEAAMLPRPEFFRLIRRKAITPQQAGILSYSNHGVKLTNGRDLEADVVILATGWTTEYGFLAERLRAHLNLERDGFYLYRQMVNPQLPNLFFIGSNTSTFCSILTYNLQARWLAELIRDRHRLPSRPDMQANIELLKAWKRRWMPISGGRGARLALHMLHYHDELLRDLGVNPLRKKGIFAPIKEVFAPYEPRDYGPVVSGGAL